MIQEAHRHGFHAIALTLHEKMGATEAYKKYAAKHGILLIPGIELSIEPKKHVVVLNPGPNVESIHTFAELAKYKTQYPDCFILAPHPFFPDSISLGSALEKHIKLFDAIENSWCYTKPFNFNTRARKIAEIHHLPFIATGDTHFLFLLSTSYAEIEVEEKTIQAIFESIRNGKFINTNPPKSFFRHILPGTLPLLFPWLLQRKQKPIQ
jgi:predicted metal-dependent phosphoesterase TrpH